MPVDPAVEDRYTTVNGVRLHYLDWGGAGEPLLFLPGNGEPASVFKWFAQRFFPQFRPLALTRRGTGKSESPDGPYTIDQLVEDVRSFLDAIHIPRVSLVGHSLGGAEATFFAAKYPDRVRKLVSLEGCFIDREIDALIKEDPCGPGGPTSTPKEALESVEAYLAYVRRTYAFVDRIWSPAAREACIADLRIDESGKVEEIDRGRAMSLPIQSIRDRDFDFGQVAVPMLVLAAIETRHPNVAPDAPPDLQRRAKEFQARLVETKRGIVQRIKREKPDVEVSEIAGAAHHCYITHEEVVYTHIIEFLTE